MATREQFEKICTFSDNYYAANTFLVRENPTGVYILFEYQSSWYTGETLTYFRQDGNTAGENNMILRLKPLCSRMEAGRYPRFSKTMIRTVESILASGGSKPFLERLSREAFAYIEGLRNEGFQEAFDRKGFIAKYALPQKSGSSLIELSAKLKKEERLEFLGSMMAEGLIVEADFHNLSERRARETVNVLIEEVISCTPNGVIRDVLLPFLGSYCYNGYPRSTAALLLDKYNGIGLPYEQVVTHFAATGEDDKLCDYLTFSISNAEQTTQKYRYPYDVLIGLFVSHGRRDLAERFAKNLITVTENSGAYNYCAAFLGKEAVDELISGGMFRALHPTFHGDREITLPEAANKQTSDGISYSDFRGLRGMGSPEWWYDFPTMAGLAEKNKSSCMKDLRDYMKENAYDTARMDGPAQDLLDMNPYRQIEAYTTALARMNDGYVLRYFAEEWFGNTTRHPELFAIRLNNAALLNKKITFAEPYGTDGTAPAKKERPAAPAGKPAPAGAADPEPVKRKRGRPPKKPV